MSHKAYDAGPGMQQLRRKHNQLDRALSLETECQESKGHKSAKMAETIPTATTHHGGPVLSALHSLWTSQHHP